MSTIGMMDGAFFVGRKEIVDWINSTLDLNISKVEETANGAIACQLLDIMHPNQVAMHKLNWAAKADFEYVTNYKVLQTAFSKLGIEKHIDVDRLVKASYMDNLEFMQWFKRFFEMHVHDKGDYDAYGQRCKGKGGATYNNGGKKAAASKSSSVPSRTSKSAPSTAAHHHPVTKSSAGHNQENATPSNINSQPPTIKGGQAAKEAAAKEHHHPATASQQHTTAAATTSVPVVTSQPSFSSNLLSQELENSKKEISNLTNALEESRKSYSDLKLDYEGLEKERDFYYDKLREIEVMLQELEDKGENNELMNTIFKVLYATADGFETGNGRDGEEPVHTLTMDSNDEAVTNVNAENINSIVPDSISKGNQQVAAEAGHNTTSEETY